eukprot:NODE_5204_length_594_cov_37.053211_g4501_i0.p2 GENE.NODE_5204_length_594_cov_37.053211_g4501_i0~~NODE_5204_length_594_cov_37.053211_g4501_i0.p2  ORF type:complete len:119 (-),score=25.38 NODE_5204_length_594_cov_37.053211_g4501_i0:210-566(-)
MGGLKAGDILMVKVAGKSVPKGPQKFALVARGQLDPSPKVTCSFTTKPFDDAQTKDYYPFGNKVQEQKDEIDDEFALYIGLICGGIVLCCCWCFCVAYIPLSWRQGWYATASAGRRIL